jgi:hypothetical protein
MRRICHGSFDQEAEMVSQTCSWRAWSELTVKSTRHWRTAGAASPTVTEAKTGGDLLIGELLRAQAQKGAELAEGIERRALDVFRERVLLGEDLARRIMHHAGHRRVLRQALLFDQQLERR